MRTTMPPLYLDDYRASPHECIASASMQCEFRADSRMRCLCTICRRSQLFDSDGCVHICRCWSLDGAFDLTSVSCGVQDKAAVSHYEQSGALRRSAEESAKR